MVLFMRREKHLIIYQKEKWPNSHSIPQAERWIKHLRPNPLVGWEKTIAILSFGTHYIGVETIQPLNKSYSQGKIISMIQCSCRWDFSWRAEMWNELMHPIEEKKWRNKQNTGMCEIMLSHTLHCQIFYAFEITHLGIRDLFWLASSDSLTIKQMHLPSVGLKRS